MSSTFVNAMILISALGSALVAGVFFAFSTFIMKALGRLQPDQIFGVHGNAGIFDGIGSKPSLTLCYSLPYRASSD